MRFDGPQLARATYIKITQVLLAQILEKNPQLTKYGGDHVACTWHFGGDHVAFPRGGHVDFFSRKDVAFTWIITTTITRMPRTSDVVFTSNASYIFRNLLPEFHVNLP